MKYFIALVSAFLSPLAWSQTSPELSRYFEEKLTLIEQSQATLASETTSSDPMVLQDFNLDLAPSVGLGMDQAVNLTLSPEIDFVFVPTPQE